MTRLKLTTAIALVTLLGQGAMSAQAGSFTANIGATTDYRFRGQSQSQTNPAIFGGVDYVSDSGLFVGLWASSIDFNDAADTYVEVDLYGGYTHALSEKTSGTVKVVYYLYPTADYLPGSNEYDYLELIASLSHDFGGITGGVEVAYSPDYFFESGDSVALTGSLSAPLTDSWLIFDGGLTASAKVGYQWIDDNATFGTPDYVFYDFGITAKVWKLAIDVRYVDTDLGETDCFGGTNLCKGAVVGTVTLALP